MVAADATRWNVPVRAIVSVDQRPLRQSSNREECPSVWIKQPGLSGLANMIDPRPHQVTGAGGVPAGSGISSSRIGREPCGLRVVK